MTGAGPAPTEPEVTSAGTDAASGVEGSSRLLLKRILIYLPGSVVPAVLALVTSMVFTRIFTPNEFGMFSLAAVVVASPLKIISTTWLVQSVGKFLPPQRTADGRRRTLDAILLATAAIFVMETVLGLVTIAVGRSLLADKWDEFLLPVALFIVITSMFEILSAVLSAEARASEYTTYKLVDSVATLGLRLLLVSGVFSMDITLMLWSVAISNGLLLPLMWVRVGLASPLRVTRTVRSPEARRLAFSFVGFGLPMTLWLFASILLDVGDRYVIQLLLGSGAVGIYDANYRLIGGLAALLVVPVTITVHPYVMGLSGAVDQPRIGRVIGTVVDNLVVVAVLAVGLTALLRQDIALILLGPEFREGSKIMPVVLAGVFLANIGTFAHKPFEIVGRTRTMVLAGFAAAAANVVFCFALIPLVGYIGAAYATFVSYLLYTVLVGALGRRIIPWHVNIRRILTQGSIVVLGIAAMSVLRSVLDLRYAVDLAATALGCAALSAFVLGSLVRRPGRDSPQEDSIE